MRRLNRNSCRPFGTSDAPSSRTTGSRPWLHPVVPPGLNHVPGNHVDCVLPMFSLNKIRNGVAARESIGVRPNWAPSNLDLQVAGVGAR